MKPTVTVVIPTTCEAGRTESLTRAVGSVLSQGGVTVDLLVVVNGVRYEGTLRRALESDPKLRVAYREQASLPGAIEWSRTLVRGKAFAFLDDDDEYLPGALTTRWEELQCAPNAAAVVTNGYRRRGDKDVLCLAGIDEIRRNPLRSIVRANWLASCGGLYSTDRVSRDLFSSLPKYYEWTVAGFRLALNHRIAFLDIPTYRVYETAGSLSRSSEYVVKGFEVVEGMMRHRLPRDVRQALRRKRSEFAHSLVEHFRGLGDTRNAWKFHLISLTGPTGWRYLPYGRKLIHI
jgi:glycosyltransferase involved in cell wall biosynthesis